MELEDLRTTWKSIEKDIENISKNDAEEVLPNHKCDIKTSLANRFRWGIIILIAALSVLHSLSLLVVIPYCCCSSSGALFLFYTFILQIQDLILLICTIRQDTLKPLSNIILTESLNYIDLINVLKASHLVLTDSGGIQEEAPSFKVKVLVLRNFTERTAGLVLGFSELVGNDKKHIVQRGHYFLNHPYILESQNPYGDGLASQRIYKHIKNFFRSNQ